MGFFSDLLRQWASGRQRKELQSYLLILKGMDNEEIYLLLRGATHAKESLENNYGINLDFPFYAIKLKSDIIFEVVKMVKSAQKTGRNDIAAALMVWAHTLRAAMNAELRADAKIMWEELSRGMNSKNKWFPDGFAPNKTTNILDSEVTFTSSYLSDEETANRIMDEILCALKMHPDTGLLIKAESDAIEDTVWLVLYAKKEKSESSNPFDIILPLIITAHEKGNHGRALALRMLALNVSKQKWIKESIKYKEILSYMELNQVTKFFYIATYQQVYEEFKVPQNVAEEMLKAKGLIR